MHVQRKAFAIVADNRWKKNAKDAFDFAQSAVKKVLACEDGLKKNALLLVCVLNVTNAKLRRGAKRVHRVDRKIHGRHMHDSASTINKAFAYAVLKIHKQKDLKTVHWVVVFVKSAG